MLGKHHGTESFSVANKPMDQVMADFQPKKTEKVSDKKKGMLKERLVNIVKSVSPQKIGVNALNIFKTPNDK